MKKISSILLSMSAIALAFSSCNKPEPEPEPSKGGTLKSSELIEAVCDFYEAWEESRVVPDEFTVGTTTLNLSEFIYAEAAQLVNIAAGKTDDIKVMSCKAATNPDRDSYDKDEIAATNGPADGQKVAEDIATIADRIMSAAAEKKQIPNQTLVYRGTEALAFSTNRAIITIARAIAAYAESGSLPATVSTEYLGATTSLKAFAEKFVKFLDVWEENIADELSADGSHCSANNNPWERVHYIPIPYKEVSICKDNEDQYIVKDFYTFEIDGVTYTSNKCWEIAIRGLFDLCTAEGSGFIDSMDDRNKPFTLADGKSLYSAPIRKAFDNNDWGLYPWYEHETEGGVLKDDGKPLEEIGLEPLLKVCSWHIVRAFVPNSANPSPLGMIGNYQQFGTSASTIHYGNYEGLICPMRELLILARFYKYILDNNITKDVYTALKDVKVSYDLYNQQLPVIVKTKSLSFDAQQAEGESLEFTATENWTVSTEDSWIHVSPASGAAGEQTVTVTADANTVNENRVGSVVIAAGDYTKSVKVSQAPYIAPSNATIKDFAQEYVKLLNVWQSNTGNVQIHETVDPYENVHFIPMDAKVTVAGVDYSVIQALEIAMRSYMLLMGYDGTSTTSKGAGNFAAVTPATMTSLMPTIVGYDYAYWYMETPGNGGPIYYKGMPDKVTLGLLENYSERNVNFASGNGGKWGNMAGYDGGRYTADFTGCMVPGRCQMAFLNFFKYMLDNNLDSISFADNKDLVVDCTLWGVKKYDDPLGGDPTIKEFAQEYVKLLDVWQNTTGDVQIHETVDAFTGVHYIPMETKFTVGTVEYNVQDALEVAMRSFMLLMGFDGNETAHKGQDGYKAVTPATLSDVVPVATGYKVNYWYMETKGNGGSLRYNGEANKATVKMLENYSERNVNFALSNSGAWGNVAGYSNRAGFTEFSGCMIPGRCQMAFLRFFKYLLDNNLDSFSYTDNQNMVVDCTLWGVDEYDAKNW